MMSKRVIRETTQTSLQTGQVLLLDLLGHALLAA
jgi:hypothetical protein